MALYKNKVGEWLNRPIENSFLNGYDMCSKMALPPFLQKKSLIYLNSNKYQVDVLFNQLVDYSMDNLNYPLFNEDLLKDFTIFCFQNGQKTRGHVFAIDKK
jgi:hypothetical protein